MAMANPTAVSNSGEPANGGSTKVRMKSEKYGCAGLTLNKIIAATAYDTIETTTATDGSAGSWKGKRKLLRHDAKSKSAAWAVKVVVKRSLAARVHSSLPKSRTCERIAIKVSPISQHAATQMLIASI